MTGKTASIAVDGVTEPIKCPASHLNVPDCAGSFKFDPRHPQKTYCQPACKDAFWQAQRKQAAKRVKGGSMCFARVSHSPRLLRALKVLSDGLPHSTLNIQDKARVCAVSTVVHELRCNGYEIECKLTKTRANGSKVFTYQLIKPDEEVA